MFLINLLHVRKTHVRVCGCSEGIWSASLGHETHPYEVIFFEHEGHDPFRAWLRTLGKEEREKIRKRIDNVKLGNLGDNRSVGTHIRELRFNGQGPGHRVYFCFDDGNRIVLLAGGDKHSPKKQEDDIRTATTRRNLWTGETAAAIEILGERTSPPLCDRERNKKRTPSTPPRQTRSGVGSLSCQPSA